MKAYILIILFYSLIFFPLSAQHTMVIAPGDIIHLGTDTCRGELQWQKSYDNAVWTDLPGRTNDTLIYVPDQFPSYFRLEMTEGNCSPHYSEVVKVDQSQPELATVITIGPRNINTLTAEAGGKITDTGGNDILTKGVVYGTSPNPTLENDMYAHDLNETDSFMVQLMGLIPNTTYYARACVVNAEGTSYGEEYSFTTTEMVTYSIGDEGPAGGIVFYDKGVYTNGWRYLETAPSGWSGGSDPWVDLDWGCYQTFIGGTSTDAGTGKENTDRIIANGCAEAGTAVLIADNADIGGYTDWFLPSRDELHALYHNLSVLGGTNFRTTYGFLTVTYTSSSEIDDNGAWGIDFAAGGNIQHLRINATIAVRPVRRF